MKITQNIILDFSHIYPEDIEERGRGLKRIDLSDIEGTNMYCTKEAENEIRRRLAACSPHGIHFLDNGNYHYATKFFAEKISFPFSLVLYDHHSDMQRKAGVLYFLIDVKNIRNFGSGFLSKISDVSFICSLFDEKFDASGH